jgi:hypothetical protein
MPYYEYRCEANGRTLEVRHGMNEQLRTWGDVAGRAGIEAGDTAADAPVERLMSVTVPLTGGATSAPAQGCGSGCACVPSN